MDTVRVSADNFQLLMFMASAAKREFVQGQRIPDDQKPQKRNGDGLPIWSVQVAGTTWRGRSELLSVSVAMPDDPGSKFAPGQPVELVGLVFGVSPKRDGSGYSTWCSAEAIAPAGKS
ncbi:MAG: hypothetical protein AB7H53_19230 [Hyphomicrobium sp.]